MRHHNQARATAIALPAEPRAAVLPWQAVAMGIFASILTYMLASLLA